ncbi:MULTISPECIES: aldo/keto reductase [Streptomyces]|jgi:Predicted oxidoreductases (related to aryl-alcohol dehydrogenases)|uniref:General stress protein 69 n=2 Tax=Streptomyces TaxID=1883 RepID=A0A1D8FZS1_9ACTN|nr:MULTISPECIES: aldo/keto reductase [Streptomyces]AOT58709.1 General stress protein 69 [Streptomyces rubrolavendulae]KAF0647092.1 aldo/keto reductase [Streptomyces fradiae ATCC 10745 = DSM 40063]OSY51320.1 General stress protein 69 [Streptomyces fradiae ATCC 10745 = DSM 40063]QEV12086.1 aldo/keto reductase [Streptomyces fradiae ATCC 10745 = DSM 40063]UQS28348.1 aldo/keto reductase [Streptomyces fradiae]
MTSDETNAPLPQVRLGATGPTTGVQGLGAMGMSEFYGDTDEAAARDTLDAALESGVTLIDTADVYGRGANEEFLAPFVAAHRDEITLATKFSMVRTDDPAYRGVRNDPAYVKAAVEGSLRRLGVDVIDLYYMHRRDPAVPLAESVGAMAELVREGKVRHLGLSEVTGPELREAHAVHPIAALQSEWSLFSRDVEVSAVPAAAELGVALVPYSPLGRGFLTGAFADAARDLPENDFRRTQPRFSGDNARSNAALLEPVRSLAAAHGATLAQIALAWVHQRAAVHGLTVVPIPGTRKRSRLLENAAATRIVLTASELDLLEPIATQVAGARYPDMSTTSAARES